MLQTLERPRRKVSWHKDEVFVQCTRCLDAFTVDATIKHGRVISLGYHPHIIHRNGVKDHCHCGGQFQFFRSF